MQSIGKLKLAKKKPELEGYEHVENLSEQTFSLSHFEDFSLKECDKTSPGDVIELDEGDFEIIVDESALPPPPPLELELESGRHETSIYPISQRQCLIIDRPIKRRAQCTRSAKKKHR